MDTALQDGGHIVPCHTCIHHSGIPLSAPRYWTMRAPGIEYDTIARIRIVIHYRTPIIQHTPFSCGPMSMDSPPPSKIPPLNVAVTQLRSKCEVIPKVNVQRRGAVAVPMHDCDGGP